MNFAPACNFTSNFTPVNSSLGEWLWPRHNIVFLHTISPTIWDLTNLRDTGHGSPASLLLRTYFILASCAPVPIVLVGIDALSASLASMLAGSICARVGVNPLDRVLLIICSNTSSITALGQPLYHKNAEWLCDEQYEGHFYPGQYVSVYDLFCSLIEDLGILISKVLSFVCGPSSVPL